MKSTTPLLLLLLSTLVAVCHAFGTDTTNSVETRLAALEQRVMILEEKVNDKEDAQILLYRDRSTCPIGYKPMENAYGRTIVIGTNLRGTVSSHSIDDTKTISMPCASMIGVAENGFHKVCNIKSGNATKLSMDIRDLIPHVTLMACAKVEPSSPVVP